MRLIIAGGRSYKFTMADVLRLDEISVSGITEIVSGGASGADKCGEEYAELRGLPIKKFMADWGKHGRAAGPIRNKQMAEYADAVVLFPGGAGTASMEAEAKKAGLTIYKFN